MAKRKPFESPRGTEIQYARDLRRVAQEIGHIVNRYQVTDPSKFPALRQALDKYAQILKPWAVLRAQSMIEQIDVQNRKAWSNTTKEMSSALQRELRDTPVGQAFHRLMNEQIELITSLPRGAAERVHKLVIQNVEQQGRAAEIAKEIQRSGEVTTSRANTIARTEVGRASTVLTQARAEGIGSEGYIWRTAHDGDVRPSHKKMEGKYVRWDSPPTLDKLTGHAGALPNCRCYPEPVIPKEMLNGE